MRKRTLTDRITQTEEGLKIWHQERIIHEVTELVCELMTTANFTRSQLAERLGKTKGYVTQLLDGETNMTLRTLSDVFFALGRAAFVSAGNVNPAAPRHLYEYPNAEWATNSQQWKETTVEVKLASN